jgi:hypothetical protein
MTDDLRRDLYGTTDRDQGLDAPLESDDPTTGIEGQALRTDDVDRDRGAETVDPDADKDTGNPFLREGTGAPDAADIDDPERMI